MMKPEIMSGPHPPRHSPGRHRDLMSEMGRGEWVIVPIADAKGLCAAARDMGGRATSYRVSGTQSCVKVLDAPWRIGNVHRISHRKRA